MPDLGKPFAGIDADLAKSKGKTKVLFVHGVGDHIPGYTTEFLEKLAKQLNLNVRSEGQKNIQLSAPSSSCYCDPKGAHYNKRMVSETSLIAFSDPNDLLSYGIPPGFSEKYLDSRLCANISSRDI